MIHSQSVVSLLSAPFHLHVEVFSFSANHMNTSAPQFLNNYITNVGLVFTEGLKLQLTFYTYELQQ